MDIKRIIEDMADTSRPLSGTELVDLTELTPADLPALKQAWVTIEAARQRQIMARLVELGRDNVELNFDSIFRYGLTDPDAEVRSQAIEGLWESEDPALIGTFVQMLEHDPSEAVQANAAAALGRFSVMAECEEIRPAYKTTISRPLLAAFNDRGRPVQVRRRALEAVAPLSLPAAKEAIRTAYESRDERFIVSAIYAMGKTCDLVWLPLLYRELENPDPEIRHEAARACGEIGIEECVSHLVEHIHDEDVEVRMAVIQALGGIGGREAKKELERIARDPNEAVKEAVEEAIAEIDMAKDMTFMEMNRPGETDDNRN